VDSYKAPSLGMATFRTASEPKVTTEI
jgi:hypothetical protein